MMGIALTITSSGVSAPAISRNRRPSQGLWINRAHETLSSYPPTFSASRDHVRHQNPSHIPREKEVLPLVRKGTRPPDHLMAPAPEFLGPRTCPHRPLFWTQLQRFPSFRIQMFMP